MPERAALSPVAEILARPAAAAELPLDAAFLERYRSQVDWLLDRLAKSTAGVRGLIAAAPDVDDASLADLDAAPQLHPAIVALFAQAYADYYRAQPPERQAACIGFDGRFFSRRFAEIFTRVFAGNGLRVLRDRNEEPTPTANVSFMSPALGLGGGVMITASHNPAVFNGIKSSTWYGGVDTDDISERIAERVRALTAGGGVVRFGALPAPEVEAIDAKAIYAERYLKATFDEAALAPLREALAGGAQFLFDGLFGVGSLAMRRYLDALLPDGAWRGGVHLLNEEIDPRIGGIAKPDPSDPQTLVRSGAIEFLTRHPATLVSVTADMDADRIGTAVLIGGGRVERARELGLSVSEFPTPRGSVWALRFTANQVFTLIAYDRLLAAAERFLGAREPEEVRRRLRAGELRPRQLHLVTSIATSSIAEQLARRSGVRFHLTAVGFKNLGMIAREIDERLPGDVILCLLEESGGAQVGPFEPWNERGDTIHRDKDTCALALALYCLAAREHGRGRSLLDLYEEMAGQLGGLAYFERLDAYVPDQATAEDPARTAEADAAKRRVLERLTALRGAEKQAELLALFGFSLEHAQRLPDRREENVVLLGRAGEAWQPEHPVVIGYQFPDGARLEWYAGGAKPEDGLRINVYGPDGDLRHWCLARASGTEALLRVYLEIVEPVERPRPERLVEAFTPFLRCLGLDEYGLEAGEASYLDAFAAAVRTKYAC